MSWLFLEFTIFQERHSNRDLKKVGTILAIVTDFRNVNRTVWLQLTGSGMNDILKFCCFTVHFNSLNLSFQLIFFKNMKGQLLCCRITTIDLSYLKKNLNSVTLTRNLRAT